MTVEKKKTAMTQASEWFALLSADYVSEQDKLRFGDWLDQSELNRQEYEKASLAWIALEDMDPAQFDAPQSQGFFSKAPQWMLHRPVWAVGAVAAAVLFIFIAFNPSPYQVKYQTVVGERRTISLPEGSQITLNTNTRLEVVFNQGTRQVWLKSGEAFFDVSPDANRPFTVKTDGGEVSVLGTRFNLRLDGQQASVALIEGRLKVSLPHAQEAFLSTGETISYSSAGITRMPETEMAPLVAWQAGKFIFRGTRLEDVIADVDRYMEESITIADASLKDIKVTGTFATDRIPELLNNLEKIIPIHVVYENNRSVRVISAPRE